MFHNILNPIKYSGISGKYNRLYRLIHYITWELIAVCVVITSLYAASRLWYLVTIICAAVTLALSNLWILKTTRNSTLCGHILSFLVFSTIVITNYLIWGIGPLRSQWFYVMPLLAASLTGMMGMLVYSTASLVMVLVNSMYSIPPYYTLTAAQFLIIEWVNYIFAYLIIITTLASLIYENRRYEQELNDKNYLLQAEKDQYHYLAQLDPLTNLPNRRYFIQHLHELIDTLPPQHCATVFFIDMDNFKEVNDRYGHNIGDELLLETTRRLQVCFREGDFIARLGGDEFTAIVLHAPDKNIPQLIAQRIIHEFEYLFKFENNTEYHFYVSIGFASYPIDAPTAPDLIIKADLAMYAAKKIPGNSFCQADAPITSS
ncbi:MAG: diguanylate cyclase [Legionella sp.]|nr:diguanylate cyclase [Legionella sp.]